MRLRQLDYVPPGGWVYTEPATGLEIRGGDYFNLRRKVLDHRINNGIPAGPELDTEIQGQICDRSPSFCVEPGQPDVVRQLNATDVVHFIRALGSWVLQRPGFVSQEEADRRAAICAGCPNNVPVVGCAGCANIPGVLMEVIGKRKVQGAEKLHGCFACGCSLPALVWAPAQVLPEIRAKEKYPKFCWRLEN